MNIKVGDSVEVKDGGYYLKKVTGLKGTVVTIDYIYIGVDFGNFDGHNLEGNLKKPTGYYIKLKDLVKISVNLDEPFVIQSKYPEEFKRGYR